MQICHQACRNPLLLTLAWSGTGVPPSPLPKPGMGITAVSRCIWIGGVPVSVREADLFKEASLIGDVLFIRFPDCPGQDEALVTFASFG